MDFIVDLPMTSREHDAIWVMVGRFTKMCHFISTKKIFKTLELARYLPFQQT